MAIIGFGLSFDCFYPGLLLGGGDFVSLRIFFWLSVPVLGFLLLDE